VRSRLQQRRSGRDLAKFNLAVDSKLRGCDLVHRWIAEVGLETSRYGTHSLRLTKATLIYRKTDNLRALQILLGHTTIESTVRYLGVEVDDALAIAEHVDL
jgi:integrase